MTINSKTPWSIGIHIPPHGPKSKGFGFPLAHDGGPEGCNNIIIIQN